MTHVHAWLNLLCAYNVWRCPTWSVGGTVNQAISCVKLHTKLYIVAARIAGVGCKTAVLGDFF